MLRYLQRNHHSRGFLGGAIFRPSTVVLQDFRKLTELAMRELDSNHMLDQGVGFLRFTSELRQLGTPVVPFYPFATFARGEGSPTKIDYRKRVALF